MMSGDYDIMTQDKEANKQYGIQRLRFGDIVAIEDHDNWRWTAGTIEKVLSALVLSCIPIHLRAVTGAWLTIIMSSDIQHLSTEIDPNANIANYYSNKEK